ncbi:putative clathrin assembly protein At1g33340 [Dioscorea cayenensis subsp. rotundata]|uniref:Clathrin assembly protein At1g33340 n=1 Tax=Dioscorea cayennensis subsp. rotundata TaxID=55577 RepID=A0AB40C096_DIOCR|nr:putative clathrin assembly protein At1g33340 [Dioscorea cayenensis subsp. rotundata]
MKLKSKLKQALGSLMEISGSSTDIFSGIDAAIARGTDRTDTPVDDKYVHEILFLVSNSPGSITFLARRITRRLETATDVILALKTLLLLHRLLRGGDRYFEQDLRSLWYSGELRIDLGWSCNDCNRLSSFIISYSELLKERVQWIINQSGKLEPVRPLGLEIQSCEENAIELVLHRLSKCQAFLDLTMECLPSKIWHSSRVTQVAMNIILREFFGVCVLFLDEYYKSLRTSMVGKSLDFPSVRVFTVEDVSAMDMASSEQLSPFHCKLETKISTVWVEFDDDGDSQSSSLFSFGGFEDHLLTSAGDDLITDQGESSTTTTNTTITSSTSNYMQLL